MLAQAIERRFAGARCAPDERDPHAAVRAEIPHDGVVYRARAAMVPHGKVAVAIPHTDGFDLHVAWTDHQRSHRRPLAFDDSCLVETNDVALAHAWLDHDARSALLASRYVSAPSPRATAVMLRDGAWRHALRRGSVVAQRAEVEASTDRIADMLDAALAIAHRPVRWARAFAKVARELGGACASRVELGGRPILRVRRGMAEVTVRLLRRLDPDEPGRLRTVIGAHRIGSAGETLSLVTDQLPRTAWPPPTSAAAPRFRIEPSAHRLLDVAQPAASVVRPHDVEITFDGAVVSGERLGAAIELAARWASDDAGSGPYR